MGCRMGSGETGVQASDGFSVGWAERTERTASGDSHDSSSRCNQISGKNQAPFRAGAFVFELGAECVLSLRAI